MARYTAEIQGIKTQDEIHLETFFPKNASLMVYAVASLCLMHAGGPNAAEAKAHMRLLDTRTMLSDYVECFNQKGYMANHQTIKAAIAALWDENINVNQHLRP